MRPLAIAAAAAVAAAALACGWRLRPPVQPDGGAADTSPRDVVANPQVFFVQIDT